MYKAEDQANNAVKAKNGEYLGEHKIRVEIAGQPKKPRGPQPNDECRFCGKIGHW